MTIDSLARRLPPSVYVEETSYDDARRATWRSWLSAEERECLASFGSAQRRREFLAGRAAARQLLADTLRMTPAAVPLRREDEGRVAVEEDDWYVSITHSDERAVAVCARHRLVGVDLERIQPRDEGVARFLLHPENRRAGLLDRLPYDRETALILCWTLKEAVLKARRSGFRCSPKKLCLDVEPDARRATVHVQGENAWDVSYEELDGFMLSVAYSEVKRDA